MYLSEIISRRGLSNSREFSHRRFLAMSIYLPKRLPGCAAHTRHSSKRQQSFLLHARSPRSRALFLEFLLLLLESSLRGVASAVWKCWQSLGIRDFLFQQESIIRWSSAPAHHVHHFWSVIFCCASGEQDTGPRYKNSISQKHKKSRKSKNIINSFLT